MRVNKYITGLRMNSLEYKGSVKISFDGNEDLNSKLAAMFDVDLKSVYTYVLNSSISPFEGLNFYIVHSVKLADTLRKARKGIASLKGNFYIKVFEVKT